MQLNEVDESRIRLEVRQMLFEFFEKPSNIIDQNLGTNIAFEYKNPPGVTQKVLSKFYERFDKYWQNQDSDEELQVHRIASILATAFVKSNPALASLKSYVKKDYWDILMGVISGYNPDDILFWIEHPGGYSDNSIQKYSREVMETFRKFPFIYTGGYLPSPKSFTKIKEAMKGKGLI